MKIQKIFHFALLIFLCSCQKPFNVPLKTTEQIKTLISSAEISASKNEYQHAIKCLERLGNECIENPDLDKSICLKIAQYYYKLGSKKKVNFANGVSACNTLILSYPDFAIENDVHLLKIKFYFENLDQNAKVSIENAESVISFIDEYSEICNSNENFKKFFTKNEKEIKNIRLKCLEIQIKKKLELGKIYIEDGHLIPALDNLTEAIQASKNSNAGNGFAREAASLICELGSVMKDDKQSFFDDEEKKYWESQKGDFEKKRFPNKKTFKKSNSRKKMPIESQILKFIDIKK